MSARIIVTALGDSTHGYRPGEVCWSTSLQMDSFAIVVGKPRPLLAETGDRWMVDPEPVRSEAP